MTEHDLCALHLVTVPCAICMTRGATTKRQERTCLRKQRFPSEKAAKAHIHYQLRHGTHSYLGSDSYVCEYCDGWHIGHLRKPR